MAKKVANMTFSNAVVTCLRYKYATFSGRASRSEYWFFGLFSFLVWIAIACMALFFFPVLENLLVLLGLAVLALLLPNLAVSVRRLHDLNKSGWWLLLYLLHSVPYLGILIQIGFCVLYCLRGTVGPNKYGPDPLMPDRRIPEYAIYQKNR